MEATLAIVYLISFEEIDLENQSNIDKLLVVYKFNCFTSADY